MNKYTLKDGSIIEAIQIGRAKIKIGDISPDGMLTICDRAPNLDNSRKARVICKCQCGSYTILNAQSFYNGTTKSCGCYSTKLHKELCKQIGKLSPQKDYSNVENPYYKFIERLDKKDSCNSFYWKIRCKKCQKEYEAVPAQIISDFRRRGLNPCDCWRNISKGSMKIKQLLIKNNINFIQEQTFEGCLSPKGYLLKFDFFIPSLNCAIEYDGEQHFISTSFGDSNINGDERLDTTQKYDKIKNNYCINNNITLIRIPYLRYKELCLEDLMPETSHFIYKESLDVK